MGSSQIKPKGWHSRRHENDAAQTEAREAYQSEHGRDARRRKAWARCRAKARTKHHAHPDLGKPCTSCGAPAGIDA